MDFKNPIFRLILLVLLFVAILIVSSRKTGPQPKKRKSISQKEIRAAVPKLGFQQIHPDPVITGLNLPGKVTKYGVDNTCGAVVRLLRFENITYIAEDKWDLPCHRIVLAIIMNEGTGVVGLLNARGDGGAGLINTQGSTATLFHLKTHDNCDSTICYHHSKELMDSIDYYHGDIKRLIQCDDRFHPILNIDMAARVIAYYSQQPIDGLPPLQSAIRHLAGRENYQAYWDNLVKTMAFLDDSAAMARVREHFNRLNNGKLTINGKVSTTDAFGDYVRVFQEQNENYGLLEYMNSQYYRIDHIHDVDMYKKFILPAKKEVKLPCP